jgi:hypothetical protein
VWSKSPPVWPKQFDAAFDVLVPKYGSGFVQKGHVFYDWTLRTMRADYYDWCIPLFGKKRASMGLYNETCTFLMTKAGTYFISPDFPVEEDRCCLFQAGLAMPVPDWLSNTQYNGTVTIRNQLCDLWWFPGTSNPDQPYYGYYDRADDETPVRFLGLSSIGETLLDYTSFYVGPSDPSIFAPPPNCAQECTSPPPTSIVMM